MIGTVFAGGDETKPIAWSPAEVAFPSECANTFLQIHPEVTCVMDVSLDSSGDLHLFSAQRPLRLDAPADHHIEHVLLSEGTFHQLPPIPVEHAPVIALKSTAGRRGELHLLWVEDEYYAPEHHDEAIYLQSYRGGVWGSRETVLDDRAHAFVIRQDDVTLQANQEGAIDVFWTDIREYHGLVDLLSMGSGGNYAKTYHRRRTGSEWSTTERIQRKGIFEPLEFQVLPNPHGLSDVLWSDSSRSTATIVRSAFSRDRWRVEETIGRCKSTLGKPQVFDFKVATDIGGHSKVAWVCSRYEITEPGTKKNDIFHDLYVSALVDGTWEMGPNLSHRASSFRWLWNGPAQSVLLLQEYVPHPAFRGLYSVPLLALTIDRNRHIATEVLSEGSIRDLFEATSDVNGTVHVVYAEPISDTEAIMKYRRGKYQGR